MTDGGRRFPLLGIALCLALGALQGCGNSTRGPASANDPSDPEPSLDSQQQRALAELSPRDLPPPPADPTNRFADDAKAASFGQHIFFDPGFAGALLDGDNDGTKNALGRKGETGKVACDGCHVPSTTFSDSRSVRRQISLGAGWGHRRAPSLLDVGQSKLLMWDGRRDALYNQIFGVIESAVEMNSSRLYYAQRVFAQYRADYEALFGDLPPLDDATRFPPLAATETGCQKLTADNVCATPQRGAPGDGAEFDGLSAADQDAVTSVVVNVGKAIGAYERLLSCGSSRFDRFMQGEKDALSRAEQRGAGLFVGKAGCVKCHSGPYLSDEKFHNVGMRAMLVATVFISPNDPGAAAGLLALETDPLNSAGKFSDGSDGRTPDKLSSDLEGAFRTPRLRCVAGRPSFMRNGQLRSLEEVVSFFDRGGDKVGFPGKTEIEPLGLSELERADLVAFLKSLDGPGPAAELLSP